MKLGRKFGEASPEEIQQAKDKIMIGGYKKRGMKPLITKTREQIEEQKRWDQYQEAKRQKNLDLMLDWFLKNKDGLQEMLDKFENDKSC